MPRPERYDTRTVGTRWRVRFRLDGRYSSKTFATLPEAGQFCRLIESLGVQRAVGELERERDIEQEMDLDAWAARHFDSITGVTDGTLSTYRRIYARVWQPRLGHFRLSHLDRELLARAVNEVSGSDKTVRNAWGVLATMLKVAVQDGHLPRSPALGVRPPRRTDHETREHRYLTHEEWWALLDATPAHWQPFVWMLGGTGMRYGEAVALEVRDVNLSAATVRITKAEKWDVARRSERVVGPTKTTKSKRTVTLPPEVVEAVRPLVEGRKAGETLFTAPRGGTVQHRTFYSDVWRAKCCAAVGDPHPRIHDLRHSHVAWLIAEGIPLPVIQQRLGHEKITTTIDTYGHLLPDVQRAAADAASRVLGNRPTPAALPEGQPDA